MLQEILPVPNQDLLHFIAYLAYQNIAASLISTYMSGISYAHKLQQVDDTTKSFLVIKALEVSRRTKGSKMDARAPISLTILHKMIANLASICQNTFELSLSHSHSLVCSE